MYGHPFLLENLPPTLLLWLTTCLLRELHREHANQILPHPITISVKLGILFSKKNLLLRWTSPHLVILMTPTAVKLNEFPQWWHLSRNN
jgi:hypothetical protein